jgi:hypothetical protein
VIVIGAEGDSGLGIPVKGFLSVRGSDQAPESSMIRHSNSSVCLCLSGVTPLEISGVEYVVLGKDTSVGTESPKTAVGDTVPVPVEVGKVGTCGVKLAGRLYELVGML